MKINLYKIKENKKIADGIYEMTLAGTNLQSEPGQFVNVKLKDKEKKLRRPFCISNSGDNYFKLIYQIVGKGTEEMSLYKKGDEIEILGPLGNSHPKAQKGQKVLLIGGGVGSAFYPYYKKVYSESIIYAYLGFSNKDKVILEKEMSDIEKLTISTDDGSYKNKGYITDYVLKDIDIINPDIIIACGPLIIYKILKDKLADKYLTKTFISLEKRMACGVGACLTCNCTIKENNQEKEKRVCKDGPTFNINKVVL